MALRVVTPPAEEPVSLLEAKAHLRLEESIDDTYVISLIAGARGFVEGECERALVLTVVELTTARPCSPCAAVPLPGGALADTPAVTVRYLDTDSELQTLDSSKYFVVRGGDAKPGELHLVEGESWPDMALRPDALQVQYSVGWANPAAVPQPLKHAVKLMLSELYENRSPSELAANRTLNALMAQFQFRSI